MNKCSIFLGPQTMYHDINGSFFYQGEYVPYLTIIVLVSSGSQVRSSRTAYENRGGRYLTCSAAVSPEYTIQTKALCTRQCALLWVFDWFPSNHDKSTAESAAETGRRTLTLLPIKKNVSNLIMWLSSHSMLVSYRILNKNDGAAVERCNWSKKCLTTVMWKGNR